MALKNYKPTSPGQRGLVLVDKSGLWKGRPEKTLTKGLTKKGGRNNLGRITVRHQGGGAKRLYREIDFKRSKTGINATVERIEYDPNRSAFIALIVYEDKQKSYILAPQRLKVGDVVISAEKADVKPGNAMPFSSMPVGTIVHNIEFKQGKGGQIARSAGTSVQIISKEETNVQIKMVSGEIRYINKNSLATIGVLSNPDQKNIKLGKAGRKRYLGYRPKVRGVVMNPVDHPHGGGEGRTSGGRHPVTPWGVSTKGKKTRRNKKTDVFIIRRRKK